MSHFSVCVKSKVAYLKPELIVQISWCVHFASVLVIHVWPSAGAYPGFSGFLSSYVLWVHENLAAMPTLGHSLYLTITFLSKWQQFARFITRALRAHTPHAHCICIIVQLGYMLSATFTYTYEASAHEQIYMHNA